MKALKIVPVCMLFILILVFSLKSKVYASNLKNEEQSTSIGYTEVKAEVKEETTAILDTDTDKPHTGDNNQIMVFLILFLASLVVMVSIKIYNIERQK